MWLPSCRFHFPLYPRVLCFTASVFLLWHGASSHRLMGSWMLFSLMFQFYFAFGLPFYVTKLICSSSFLESAIAPRSPGSLYWDIIHNLDMNHRCACVGKRGHFSQSLSNYRTKNYMPLYQSLHVYIFLNASISNQL